MKFTLLIILTFIMLHSQGADSLNIKQMEYSVISHDSLLNIKSELYVLVDSSKYSIVESDSELKILIYEGDSVMIIPVGNFQPILEFKTDNDDIIKVNSKLIKLKNNVEILEIDYCEGEIWGAGSDKSICKLILDITNKLVLLKYNTSRIAQRIGLNETNGNASDGSWYFESIQTIYLNQDTLSIFESTTIVEGFEDESKENVESGWSEKPDKLNLVTGTFIYKDEKWNRLNITNE